MPETFLQRIRSLISLQCFAALLVTLLIFGGRFGFGGNPQASGLSAISTTFHENFFQVRWWLTGALLMLAGADYCLGHRIGRGQNQMPMGLIGYGLVLIPLILSIIYAGGSDHTTRKFVDLIVLTLIILGVHYWASRPSREPCYFGRIVLIYCLGIGLILSFVAVSTAEFSDRLAFGDGGPNTFVRIVGVTALAGLGLRAIPRPLAILLTLGLLTLVVLTQSRGGLLACITALGLLFARTFGWRQQLFYVGSLLTGIGVLATCTEFGRHCVDIIEDRFINKTFHDRYTAGRDTIFSDAVDIWMESFLFGHGLNSWWDRIGNYPHNIFLELGCDAGAVAVLGFLILLALYAWESLRRRDQTRIAISCAIPLYFVAAQFSGDIYDSRSLFIFGTILMACRQPKMKKSEKPRLAQPTRATVPSTADRFVPSPTFSR